MIYGLFFSAGNQSRFGSQHPKALSSINGRILLDYNIESISPYVDRPYVVCSPNNQHFFNKYDKIVINSGKGCGDAVMEALKVINPKNSDSCYVQWGDSLVDNNLYPLIKTNEQAISIPCTLEHNPYVQIIPYNNTARVKFSKYEPTGEYGLHDQSVFYMPAQFALKELIAFANKITHNGKYQTKYNNEMLFLDLFNQLDTKALIVQNNLKAYSFNTIKELAELNNGR